MQGCSREGQEKPDPELFTLIGVVFKSCMRFRFLGYRLGWVKIGGAGPPVTNRFKPPGRPSARDR